MSRRPPAMTKTGFVARARLRHQLRLFERFTEEACAQAGITMPQYLLLLQLRGRPDREWALVGELAECLVLKHHTTVELVGRCEAAGLVRRERDEQDQRKVRVLATPRGRRLVERVAAAHDQELDQLLGHMRESLGRERTAALQSAGAARKRG